MFNENLKDNISLEKALRIMCNAHEYDELPVRHNEDLLNEYVNFCFQSIIKLYISNW